ncbi:hypothetical protein [Prevotella sp. P6B1]|uniref:hypothetical protein n=1 Tax=Prevotella sp. P6B1 TaxID=1410613 RepID=UPI0012DE80E0|nr:hypothetical protein [Prevotella sp. P6B1]
MNFTFSALRGLALGCTFKVSRHDSHKKVVAKAEHMKGVMNTKWNPRTRELTAIYYRRQYRRLFKN